MGCDQIRVVVADDHPIIRKYLKRVIKQHFHITFWEEASNGVELMECLKTTKPDIVVVDLKMPGFNEYDSILKIRADYPHIKIVVFSGFLIPENQQQIKEMGVDWSISKTEGMQQIITAFNSVMEGKSYHSDVRFCKDAAISLEDTNDILTLREKQILMLITQGKTSREMGRVLCISKATVDKHRANIKEKLGLKNVAEMVRYALNLN